MEAQAVSEWIVIVGAGLVTFLTRASFIVFADPQKFPHAFRVALAFVPASVLAAIVVPGLAMPAGTLDLAPDNLRLVAGLAAMAVAARIRNPLAAIVAGMAALWGLQALAG
jgi:branched-subunit amino acid transport protein